MSHLQPNAIEHYLAVSPLTSSSILADGQQFHQQALSRPPSYLTHHESDIMHSEAVQELADYYSRQNTRRNNHLDRLLFWNTASQFRGSLFLIWTILLIFAGCVLVFTGPTDAQALWIVLGVYFIFAFVLFQKRRKEVKRIADLERCVRDQRLARQALLDQSHPLPEGYYFEIQNHTKDHTHPVVTLLPPPPAYANSSN